MSRARTPLGLWQIQTGLGCHAVDENLCSSNGVPQIGPGSVGRDEMRSVFRLVVAGDAPQLRIVAHTFRRSFNDGIETLEGALPFRKDAMTVCRKVLRFSLVWSPYRITEPFEPDSQQGRHMRATVRLKHRKPIHLSAIRLSAGQLIRADAYPRRWMTCVAGEVGTQEKPVPVSGRIMEW